jgi:sodium/pantothenate symporter
MDIYAWTMLASIAVYILVGNYAGRRVKAVDDYFVAGRKAPTLFILGTLVASYLSTNTFLGETGKAYSHWAGQWLLYPPLLATGYVYGALYFGRYLRRSRALTVASYLGERFNSRRIQVFAGVTIMFGLGIYLLAVTQGAALLLSQLTPVTYTGALVIACASYLLFTMYAGSRGVVITDTLMFILFTTASLFAMYFILDFHDGWAATLKGLVTLDSKPDLMAWHAMAGPGMEWETPWELLIWQTVIGVAWSLVVAISPWQSSRYLMAKNEHVVIRSACLAAIFVIAIGAMLYAAAVSVNLTNPGIEPHESVMIWAATNILPPFLGALMLAGIMAAALSSATTFLSLVGFSLSHDILPERLTATQGMLKFSRYAVLGVGLIVLVIAFFIPQDIWWLTNFAGPVFASSWGPVAFMSVWSRRITASGAFWGMVAGFFGNVITKIVDTAGWIDVPVYLHPVVIGAALSLLVIIAVSRAGQVTEAESRYREKLHELPEEDRDPAASRSTHWLAAAVSAFGVFATAGFLFWYVLPYQEITGRLLTDGSPDWFSGESLHAYGWAVVYVSAGLLTHRVVRRTYR